MMPRPRGKVEADLALEIRNWLHMVAIRSHRIKADKYAGAGHKKHEAEEPGTPDYICLAHRSYATTAWGKAFIARARAAGFGEDVVQFIRQQLEAYTYEPFYWEAKREIGGTVNRNQRIWIDDARKRGVGVIEGPRSIWEVEQWLKERGLAR